MSKSPEATRHHNLTKLLVLLHLGAIYFNTFQYETPCRTETNNMYVPPIKAQIFSFLELEEKGRGIIMGVPCHAHLP